jgi:DNA-binding response OmpR family regulator
MMKTVLIVDDDADMRRLIAVLLDGEFTVVQARDGSEGLRALQEHHPALAIIDLGMPGMSGLDLLRAARKDGGSTSFIMLTGSHENDSIVAALAAGAATYITKPWEPERLRAEIRRHLSPAKPGRASGRPWRIER